MLVGGGLQGGGLQVYVSDLGMTKYNVFSFQMCMKRDAHKDCLVYQ